MLPRALLVVALLPSSVFANCSPSGAPQGYGPSWWRSYKAWCRGCGGRVADTHSSASDCALPASSGSRASSGGAAPGAALGQAIGAGIVEMYRQGAAKQKIVAEQLRLQQVRDEESRLKKEAERKVKFDAEKNGLLDKMGGGPQTLALKDDEGEPAQAELGLARDQHNQDSAERRAALGRLKGKPEETWCKLHLPQALLMPERPIHDVGERYAGMMSAFEENRAEWDERCGGPSASQKAEGKLLLKDDE
ncbi:MAG: hypothetical protein HYZ75_14790 [Elusimicrobia bacterium]|nr:hypothetical protein [Elusimicrobiota bacterium]